MRCFREGEGAQAACRCGDREVRYLYLARTGTAGRDPDLLSAGWYLVPAGPYLRVAPPIFSPRLFFSSLQLFFLSIPFLFSILHPRHRNFNHLWCNSSYAARLELLLVLAVRSFPPIFDLDLLQHCILPFLLHPVVLFSSHLLSRLISAPFEAAVDTLVRIAKRFARRSVRL